MRLFYSIVFALGIGLFLTGCGDANVDLVKGSNFKGNKTATIEAVMKNNFDNGSWKSFEENGETKVKFSGKINPEAHKKATALAVLFVRQDASVDQYRKQEQEEKLKPYNEKLKAYEKSWAQNELNIKINEFNSKKKQFKKTQEEYENKLRRLKHSRKENQDAIKSEEQKIESIENEISLIEKSCGELLENSAALREEHKKKVKEYWEETVSARERINKELFEDIKEKEFWPVGCEVEFIWTIYSNKKGFELSDITGGKFEGKFSTDSVVPILISK